MNSEFEYGTAEINATKYIHVAESNGTYGVLYTKNDQENHRPGDWKMYLNLSADEVGQLMGGN
jgi:hypothetical protein